MLDRGADDQVLGSYGKTASYLASFFHASAITCSLVDDKEILDPNDPGITQALLTATEQGNTNVVNKLGKPSKKTFQKVVFKLHFRQF